MQSYAVQPIQQYSYVPGKNATDSALITDAMDLLCTGNCDGFCLVSSDSDFTRLARRLREARLFAYGFGRKQTPEAFQKACDKFTYTEIFGAEDITVVSKANQADEQEDIGLFDVQEISSKQNPLVKVVYIKLKG